MNYSSLRKAAREQLKGNWTMAALATLIIIAFGALAGICMDASILPFFAAGTITWRLIAIAALIIALPLSTAYAIATLRLAKGNSTNLLTDNWNAWKQHFGKLLGAQLLIVLLVLAIAILVIVLMIIGITIVAATCLSPDLLTDSEMLSDLLIADPLALGVGYFVGILLCGVFSYTILLVLSCWIQYMYILTPFIIEENQTLSATQAMRMSRKLMKGHKGQAFVLDLTFIGWALVSILTLGIASLWVIPYQQTARANFYLTIIPNEDVTEQLVADVTTDEDADI